MLVTGAAGGVGRYVVAALQNQDVEIVAVDVAEAPAMKGVRRASLDITDLELLTNAAQGCDVVVHLAAIPAFDPERNWDICRTNVLGTETVFEASVRAGVRRVVQASSICATGFIYWSRPSSPTYFPIDEAYDDVPDDLYGLSKLFAELLATAYEKRYGLETTSYRMATVWQPDHDPTDKWLAEVLEGDRDDDLMYRDLRWQYVDVRDVAQAFVLGVRNATGLGICNVGAADCPGGDWRVWLRDLYPEVGSLRTPAAYMLDRALPLWSIERLATNAGYRPTHGWQEYPVFVDAWTRYQERKDRVKRP